MSSLNLTIAMLRASGSLPKSPCAKIDKLKSVEKKAHEKRAKVAKSAKTKRSKALQRLHKKVKQEIAEIDDTYGKPGKPSKCSPTKRAAKVPDSPELRRGTKAEQKEHGHGKKNARQIAADHLAEDPHFYDTKPKAKSTKARAKKVAKAAKRGSRDTAEMMRRNSGDMGDTGGDRRTGDYNGKKVRAKKVAAVTKAAREGQREVDAFEAKAARAVKSDVKKAKAEIKRETAAAKKKIREDAATAKREARKQAKAAAHRPVAQPKPSKPAKPVRAAKPEKPPKQPRAKKAAMRRNLPEPREQTFVADAPAANDAVDPAKDAAALTGLENMVARMMAAKKGGVVESMPARLSKSEEDLVALLVARNIPRREARSIVVKSRSENYDREFAKLTPARQAEILARRPTATDLANQLSRRKPKSGYVYAWTDDESFSNSDHDIMSDRDFVGARYTGTLAAEGSLFDTWKLKDGRNIAQTAIGAR